MWLYNGKQINSLNDIPKELRNSYGFVYNIVCSNGMEYIGQKRLASKTKKFLSDRAVKQRGKEGLAFVIRKNKRKYYEWSIKETNWLTYTGSSKKLNEDIRKNGVTFTKYILDFCSDKTLLNYLEHKNIMCTSAMEEEKFYNDHTQIKVFKKNILNKK